MHALAKRGPAFGFNCILVDFEVSVLDIDNQQGGFLWHQADILRRLGGFVVERTMGVFPVAHDGYSRSLAQIRKPLSLPDWK